MTAVRWRPFAGAVRPVPEPVPTPFIWAGAYGGALVLLVALGAADGLQHPGLALTAFCCLAAVLGVMGRAAAAPGAALVCCLFYNGFVVPPKGELRWDGYPDAYRLGLLLMAFVLGTGATRLVNARAAYRRVTPHTERPDTFE
ncbi:hypothetical protein ACIGEZ_24395 [Streptomyces sp. NPDC085481]|uniref:hypothetical protein n=1 Tax=Streptomyces sp. NPDC085481 TaxID=3365727 RepID=UPI0037D87A73